jgi:hypothetical protein
MLLSGMVSLAALHSEYLAFFFERGHSPKLMCTDHSMTRCVNVEVGNETRGLLHDNNSDDVVDGKTRTMEGDKGYSLTSSLSIKITHLLKFMKKIGPDTVQYTSP